MPSAIKDVLRAFSKRMEYAKIVSCLLMTIVKLVTIGQRVKNVEVVISQTIESA